MNTTELIELLKASEIGRYSGKPFQVEIFNGKLGEGRKGLVLHKDDTLEFSSSGDSKEDPRLFLHIVGDNLDPMITTTKQEIRKAVMEALEEFEDEIDCNACIKDSDYPSVADLVAETLGGEG